MFLEDQLCLNVEVRCSDSRWTPTRKTRLGAPASARRRPGDVILTTRGRMAGLSQRRAQRAVWREHVPPLLARDGVRGRCTSSPSFRQPYVHVEVFGGAGRVRAPHLAHGVATAGTDASCKARATSPAQRSGSLDITHEARLLATSMQVSRSSPSASSDLAARRTRTRQLREAEGLRHVIVCARVQADDHVDSSVHSEIRIRDAVPEGRISRATSSHPISGSEPVDSRSTPQFTRSFGACRVCAHVVTRMRGQGAREWSSSTKGKL